MIDSSSEKNVEKPAIENFCSFMKKIGRFLEKKIPANCSAIYDAIMSSLKVMYN